MTGKLPPLGIGTFQLKTSAALHSTLDRALAHGIRLIDTAQCYKNEALLSQSLEELLPLHGLSRSEVVIVSKLDPKSQGRAKAGPAVDRTVELFGGYVDVMLIHWPGVSGIKADDPGVRSLREESWRVLESYADAGKIKNIGVSNYTMSHLQELLGYCRTKPTVLQNEFHPRYRERELQELCAKHGIAFMGYSPFGQGDLLTDKTVMDIAAKHTVTPAQVLIRWSVQQHVTCIPRTSRPERVEENFRDISKVELDEGDMRRIDGLNDNHKYCWDPSNVIY